MNFRIYFLLLNTFLYLLMSWSDNGLRSPLFYKCIENQFPWVIKPRRLGFSNHYDGKLPLVVLKFNISQTSSRLLTLEKYFPNHNSVSFFFLLQLLCIVIHMRSIVEGMKNREDHLNKRQSCLLRKRHPIKISHVFV